MATVGHIGKLVRSMAQKLFVVGTIHVSSYFEVSELISGINFAFVMCLAVMGVTMGTGTFKPEKNLVFFRIKSPGPHRCHPGKLE